VRTIHKRNFFHGFLTTFISCLCRLRKRKERFGDVTKGEEHEPQTAGETVPEESPSVQDPEHDEKMAKRAKRFAT
jgi:hypothetical protein